MATYYMRADGTAADKESATSDLLASTSMSIATHNTESPGFSAGDNVMVSDAGGVYRDQLNPGGSGSGVADIEYIPSGSPEILGSDDLNDAGDWTNETSDEETGGIFASGIEDEVDAFTTDFTGKTTAGSNTAVTSTAAGTYNTGSKGGKLTFDGSNANCFVYKTISDQTTVYVRAMIKLNSSFALSGDYQIADLMTLYDDTGTAVLIKVGVQCSTTPWTSLKWFCYAYNPNNAIYTSGDYGEVSLNTWYRIEIKFVQGSGSDGEAEVWIDGVSQGTPLSAQTWSTNEVDTIRIGGGSGGGTGVPDSAAEIYFDDVKADTSAVGVVDAGATDYWYTADLGAVPEAVYRNDTRLTEVATKGELTDVGKWWPSGNVVYTYAEANPTTGGHTFEASIRTKGIYINTKNYLSFTGIAVSKIAGRAIDLWSGGGANSTNITIEDCELQVENVAGSACVYANTDSGSWANLVIRNNRLTPYTAATTTPVSIAQRYGINFIKLVTSFDIDGNVVGGAGEDGIVVDDQSGNASTPSYIRNNTLGLNGENSIDVKDCQNVIVSGNVCDNDGESNIVIHDDGAPTGLTKDIIVEENVCTKAGQLGTPRHAIYLEYVDDSTVRRNLVMTGHAGGIYVDDKEASANNNEVYHNIIANCGTGTSYAAGIGIGDCVGTKVRNNVIYGQGSDGDGIYLYGGANATGITVQNNIVLSAARYSMRVLAAADVSLTINYNCYSPDGSTKFDWKGTEYNFADWQTNSAQDANSVNSDPLFVNAGGASLADYKLRGNSPCRRAGTPVGLKRDIGGQPIPSVPDIGAWQGGGRDDGEAAHSLLSHRAGIC